MAKGDGINLDILPHHRKAGAEASKRATARAIRLQAMEIPEEEPQPVRNPFARSHGAIADLCSAFGYPPAVIPKIKPSIVHRLKVPEDNVRMPVPKELRPPKVRGTREQIYRTVDGVDQRLCPACGRWLPLNKAVFRWRSDRQRKAWHGECRSCKNARRREYNLVRAGL